MPIGLMNFPIQESPIDIGGSLAKGIAARLARAQAQKAEAEAPYAGRTAESNALYKEAMAKYLMSPGKQVQGLSPLGKNIMEQNLFKTIPNQKTGGEVPNPNYDPSVNFTPSGDPAKDAYQLQQLKMTTDANTRQRNLLATNIGKTMNNINVDDLTRYSGIGGTASKIGEMVKGGFGKESAAFDDYQKSAQNASLLAKQVRQFYGDSIQPAMLHKLELMTDPTTWYRSPKVAKSIFEETKKVLDQEMKTYRDAMRTKNVYTGEDQEQSMKFPKKTVSDMVGEGVMNPSEGRAITWKRVGKNLVRA